MARAASARSRPLPASPCPPDCHPGITSLFYLWQRKTAFNDIPRQQDFAEQELAGFVDRLSLLAFDYRLEQLTFVRAAPFLQQKFGRDPSGCPVHTCYRGATWLAVWKDYRQVIDKENPSSAEPKTGWKISICRSRPTCKAPAGFSAFQSEPAVCWIIPRSKAAPALHRSRRY
ncbi:hypothetical protein DFP90_105110 [Aestuariispira insulae]|uniref:Uncharacterized protein n=1 Tax=Aestuariispira insulae TaxID=1461337 RepID=A0A3D9HJP8_9PROT|nr:hypothetical protein DFP90_105110 [Aestuariispira insulae]